MQSSLAMLSAIALALPAVNAYWKGFNIGANLASNGACKAQSDWERDFSTMAGLPGGFTSARLYASSDCDTLANAVPAALAHGVQLLVGVWAEDGNHYNAEKQALLNAINNYGHDWILAVSVGSEDLYRANTDDGTLAQQIYDVRGMLTTVIPSDQMPQVGHVDTWTAWVTNATQTIQASDFIGTDGYPYFQNTDINDAYNTFWQSVDAVRNTVNNVHPGAWVWITETGWPITGNSAGAAVPSGQNAQQYWNSVACDAFNSGHTFWYTLQDYSSNPSFGVVDSNYNPIINLNC